MDAMRRPPRPVPPEAEMIRLATEIRSYKPQIDEANARVEQLLDERATLIKRMYDHGLRYIDMQPLLGMNGGSIAVALKRAARAQDNLAIARADDLVNERTIDHGA